MAGLTEARESMKRRGTVGKFTRFAKSKGMSVGAAARKYSHAGGKLGKEASFAKGAQKHFKGSSK